MSRWQPLSNGRKAQGRRPPPGKRKIPGRPRLPLRGFGQVDALGFFASPAGGGIPGLFCHCWGLKLDGGSMRRGGNVWGGLLEGCSVFWFWGCYVIFNVMVKRACAPPSRFKFNNILPGSIASPNLLAYRRRRVYAPPSVLAGA
ncbi:MAG: hypothetical protein LBT14_08670 [Treponema sp.]|jgi:hypothetical protein|nr:hypothetical protein [Treponema sp.]